VAVLSVDVAVSALAIGQLKLNQMKKISYRKAH